MIWWRYLTGFFMPADLVFIFVYDYLADRFGGNAATISRTCLDIATKYPSFLAVVCYLLGVLAAHLFAPRPGTGTHVHWVQIVAAAGIPLIIALVNLMEFLWPAPVFLRMISEGPGFREWFREIVPVLFWINVGVVVGSIAVAQHWQA
jgi:hypothetical protein